RCSTLASLLFVLYSYKTYVLRVAFFFFSSRRRHTRFKCDWSSDVCSSDLFSWTKCPVARIVAHHVLARACAESRRARGARPCHPGRARARVVRARPYGRRAGLRGTVSGVCRPPLLLRLLLRRV